MAAPAPNSRAVFLVDAFVDGPFSGNPAAVVLLHRGDEPSEAWMQHVAAEFAQTETAFVGQPDEGLRPLRWFTPTTEVDLCGHATMAAVAILLGEQTEGAIDFTTRSGRLSGWRAADRVTIELPADPSDATMEPEPVMRAIGRPVLRAAAGREYVVAELASEEDVAAVRPDLDAIPALGRTGLVITARGQDGADVVCRMFAPQCAIPEDPVTGSAWCALAPWWQRRAGASFRARQLSARGGVLDVELSGDRVRLTGRVRVVMRGELLIDPGRSQIRKRQPPGR